MNFRSLEDFWAFYMNQHSKASTRRWHFAGTLSGILFFFCSLFFGWWFLFLVPLSGYGCALYSHLFVERNCPETLRHPFWSLLCDFKMFGSCSLVTWIGRSKGAGRDLCCKCFDFCQIFLFFMLSFVALFLCFRISSLSRESLLLNMKLKSDILYICSYMDNICAASSTSDFEISSSLDQHWYKRHERADTFIQISKSSIGKMVLCGWLPISEKKAL
ncbi:hypothetical protein E2542_SST13299 [Spatholobus suberectus]|nr:hypothetical protein E2542_SST13299 [Spatholobus suberectus]